jgi:NAD(P)-dependent dehydrogenase (short-subunit alcohol dehydrogenase family)
MARPLMCPPALFAKDLKGQVAIVTGGNSGIGLVTVEQLAKQGATVVLACRKPADGEAAKAQILAKGVSGTIDVVALDLADLASVRAFAATVLARHPRISLLINNAGVMNTPQQKTKDGFEMQFGTNHLGHFLLTELLLERLKASAPARIVTLSSTYHDVAQGREGHIDFNDLQFEKKPYDGWAAYAQSKLANVLHAKELAQRLQGTGVVAVSVHPGWVRTNLARNTMPVWVQNTIARPVMRLAGMIEPWEGAQASLYAALADDVVDHNGAYYSQLGLYRDKSANKGGFPLRSPNPEANDDAIATRLAAVSRQLTGLA